jgi:hypothetical protein
MNYITQETAQLIEACKALSDYVHAEQCSTDGRVTYSTSTINHHVFQIRAALAQPEQAECGNTPYDEGPFTITQPAKPVEFQGYAGVSMWLGKHRITQLLTEAEIQHEWEEGASLTRKAQYCLESLAAAAKERT